MSRPRTTMRKIREVLRLRLAEGLSPRQISASLGLPRITVRRHLDRAVEKGITWPLPVEMDDRALEDMLFARVDPTISETRPMPEWVSVHRELRR
ncbi:MAG TPA: sigma factor-like helix-turn-helix DNA-binding protein, partial [Candidatus Micrarchaeaceae archaeon]|nr:sigma factor-like helix-turn-helix DNA-binding protein [Candidatus Micrarchaeaceae archaeon]